ncbi:UNVERIFIED_CONTAM: Endoglucanase 23 [Sesamum angustifolium]|uniref:Endoglucanase n=1 Tax=Sesamum angustifolium TaxID=2727405 RepID=A0AAW2QDC2_9LAMI
MCTLIPESSSYHIEFTPGGLIYRPGGSNLQHATTISFLLLVYANYLEKSSQTVNCGEVSISPSMLRQIAQRQVNYILGENPKGMSYMVGYSNLYPQRIHHRGSSLPSTKDHPQVIGCKEGSIYFNSSDPNPNVLVGAIVVGRVKMMSMRMIELIFGSLNPQLISMHHLLVFLHSLWPILILS